MSAVTTDRQEAGEEIEQPINRLNGKLLDVRATLDLVYTVCQGDTFDNLEQGTLCSAMSNALRRLDEALSVADELNVAAAPARAVGALSAVHPGYTDDTGPRIRAYLASVQPMQGVADVDVDPRYVRGRSLIERVARNARGSDEPTLKLSVSQCADVLHFVAMSEPVDRATWYVEPEDAPSHVVGHHFVLEVLEASLRRAQ